jgi:hypothetical protein
MEQVTSAPPNMRVQRTRVARFARSDSPLTRRPLDDVRVPKVVAGLMLAFVATVAGIRAATPAVNQESGLPSHAIRELAKYLKSHHMTPAEYVISKFRHHEIVFLGEEHYIKQNVKFVQDLIPALYAARIYNLGIEFGADDYQRDVDQLITADRYDEGLARRIVFNHFVLWGYTDYIDIYRKAWELNHSLPRGARKFRVVNLNYRPDWTALQGPRTHEAMLKVWFKGDPDVYMGNRVLHEFADKHEKALIYAGFHHTFTHYHQPNYDFQKKKLVGFTTKRMGNVVYDSIPDRVFGILLHTPWTSREGPGHWIAPVLGAVDAAMAELHEEPEGFDVKDSPFGNLPDLRTYYSIGYPDFTLAALTDGYIYLVPFRKFESVTVDDKFVTSANLQEAISNFWDPEARERIKTPEDLLRLIRNDADEVAQFRHVE